MRIVHYNLTTTTKEGGVETLVWELSRLQVQRGHTVTIIGGAGRIDHAVPGIAVRRYPFIDRMSLRRLRPLRRHIELTKLLERLSMLPAALPAVLAARPDIVHLHKPYDMILAPLVHRIGARVIYHGHGEDFFPGDRLLIREIDAVLSCSGYNAETLIRRYGGTPIVVFNGFDPRRFHPRPADPVIRGHLGTPDERIALIVVRLQPWKGIQYAIESLALLPASLKVRLVIGGTGTYRTSLEELVAARGLGDKVTFLGTVPHDEMADYYSVADVVLGTSFASETFGMALCEALACGRPVIASSWAGYREVVIDGETGWVVQQQNPGALARAIEQVLADPAEATRRAERGRQRVERLFTWSAVAERIDRVYTHLLPPVPQSVV